MRRNSVVDARLGTAWGLAPGLQPTLDSLMVDQSTVAYIFRCALLRSRIGIGFVENGTLVLHANQLARFARLTNIVT